MLKNETNKRVFAMSTIISMGVLGIINASIITIMDLIGLFDITDKINRLNAQDFLGWCGIILALVLGLCVTKAYDEERKKKALEEEMNKKLEYYISMKDSGKMSSEDFQRFVAEYAAYVDMQDAKIRAMNERMGIYGRARRSV